eukprot:scaffold3909_cov269-Prasinococcus_capsulatus_cf.AAC.1
MPGSLDFRLPHAAELLALGKARRRAARGDRLVESASKELTESEQGSMPLLPVMSDTLYNAAHVPHVPALLALARPRAQRGKATPRA